MALFSRKLPVEAAAPERPRLDLSGPRLKHHLEQLVSGAEKLGGIERYAEALKLRAEVFRRSLEGTAAHRLDEMVLRDLVSLMPTVRRRIVFYLDTDGIARIRTALQALFDGADDTASTDARLADFCAAFPQDRKHRWVRDFGAEMLHGADPERYPLMCRWVWDAQANTGVIREIWYVDMDHGRLDVPDGYETCLVLREELSGFLNENGVFRDMMQYVDLLTAQVYANYICSQGGTYLRADFSSPEDPMEHTRRLLGLDGATVRFGRSHRAPVEGEAVEVGRLKSIE